MNRYYLMGANALLLSFFFAATTTIASGDDTISPTTHAKRHHTHHNSNKTACEWEQEIGLLRSIVKVHKDLHKYFHALDKHYHVLRKTFRRLNHQDHRRSFFDTWKRGNILHALHSNQRVRHSKFAKSKRKGGKLLREKRSLGQSIGKTVRRPLRGKKLKQRKNEKVHLEQFFPESKSWKRDGKPIIPGLIDNITRLYDHISLRALQDHHSRRGNSKDREPPKTLTHSPYTGIDSKVYPHVVSRGLPREEDEDEAVGLYPNFGTAREERGVTSSYQRNHNRVNSYYDGNHAFKKNIDGDKFRRVWTSIIHHVHPLEAVFLTEKSGMAKTTKVANHDLSEAKTAHKWCKNDNELCSKGDLHNNTATVHHESKSKHKARMKSRVVNDSLAEERNSTQVGQRGNLSLIEIYKVESILLPYLQKKVSGNDSEVKIKDTPKKKYFIPGLRKYLYYPGFIKPDKKVSLDPHLNSYVVSEPPVHVTKDVDHFVTYNINEYGRVHREVCHNGGLFVPISQREFQCICPEKYLGKTCNERNFCRPCPCKNSGKCYIIDRSPRYKCDCSIGYLGYNCERRNPCYPSRCNNGGSCTHDGLTATCVCPPKFTGQFCDELRNCVPNPCLNNGMCIEKSGAGKFECDCAPEYKGSVCGKIRYCNSNPCKNSGECHEEDDGFKCTCVTPWQGDTCEQRICSPNPCKNAGTCVEIAEGSKFKCICQKWTTGTLCEEVRPCLLKPCLNGGRCIDAFSGYNWMYGPLQYYCLCSPPYHGMNCEVNQCKNCHEHAHCQVDHCVCDDGYIGNGLLCTVKPDPCHPNPCRNDGECVADDDGSYQCNCKKPFLPPKCEREDPCADNPCLHGECKIQGDSYECICKGDWVGKLCDDKDPCRNNPCANGGICKGVGKPKKAQCICKGKWVPPLCKECRCPKRGLPGIPDPECDKQSGECVCPSGFRFEGDQCIPEEDKTLKGNPCERAPCLNGGTCIPSADSNSYTCKCSPSYYGKDCEYKRVCASNPCKNGGTCKEENGKFVACVCPQGFAQPFCSKEPTSHGYCQTYVNPCKNGGQCVSNGNAYDCVCPIRYTGPNCGVDKCANCDDNARCLNGKCRCNAGFIGSGYECIKDSPGQQQMLVVETTCQPCPQHASCVDNSCQCNPGYSYVDSFCLPANPLGQKKAALSNPTSENVKSKKHRIP